MKSLKKKCYKLEKSLTFIRSLCQNVRMKHIQKENRNVQSRKFEIA